MRHKYGTEALVLARTPVAEESLLLTLLTKDVGLVRARAQGLRKAGAKLASSLQTFSQTDVMLVYGKEGWRLSGAVLSENWFPVFSRAARLRAARVSSLLLRLVPGESPDPLLYAVFSEFLQTLALLPEELQDPLECLAALRILSALGLDAGELPDTIPALYTRESLQHVEADRTAFVARVNRGIAASGL